MRLSATFSVYIGRQFLAWVAIVAAAVLAIILLAETIELLRRASTRTDVGFVTVIELALLKLPHTVEKVVPFAVLFGSILTFWRLNRSHELVVARAAGVSAWQFLLPALTIAIAIAVFKVGVFNPVASTLMHRYDRLENTYLGTRSSLLELSSTGVWLREASGDGYAIIHARQVAPQTMQFDKLLVLRFTADDRFVERIDAPHARLEGGLWRIDQPRITDSSGNIRDETALSLETELTQEKILDSFASPESVSFWSLPDFIRMLERAGFSGIRHRMHLQAQLADPLLLCAMVLIAAAFTLRPTRRGGVGALIASGAAVAFFIYFASDVVFALGLSDRLPVMLAAWSPAAVSMSIGLATMFHLEDG